MPNYHIPHIILLSLFSHYLFSGVCSFSLLAGASCRSGRLAKSSCSASPIARDRTTIFPSLDTQTNETHHKSTQVCRQIGTGTHTIQHTPKHKQAVTDKQQHTQHTFIHVQRESGREVVDCCEDIISVYQMLSLYFTLQCISTWLVLWSDFINLTLHCMHCHFVYCV